jgi:hypothetical protein
VVVVVNHEGSPSVECLSLLEATKTERTFSSDYSLRPQGAVCNAEDWE